MNRLVRPLVLGGAAALLAAIATWRLTSTTRTPGPAAPSPTLAGHEGPTPGPVPSQPSAVATVPPPSGQPARVTYDFTLDGPPRVGVPDEIDRDEVWATAMEGFLARHGAATLGEFLPDAIWDGARCFSTTCHLVFRYDPTLRDEARVVYNFVAVNRYRPSEETTDAGLTRVSLVVQYLDRDSGDRQTPEAFLDAERAMPPEFHQFRERVKRELAAKREP